MHAVAQLVFWVTIGIFGISVVDEAALVAEMRGVDVLFCKRFISKVVARGLSWRLTRVQLEEIHCLLTGVNDSSTFAFPDRDHFAHVFSDEVVFLRIFTYV